MEMVGLHTEKTARKHNLSGLVMESPVEERKRKTQKQVETRTGDRDYENGMSLKDLKKMAFDKRLGEICLRTHTSMGLQVKEKKMKTTKNVSEQLDQIDVYKDCNRNDIIYQLSATVERSDCQRLSTGNMMMMIGYLT
jgi:hypothetical protein